MAKRVRFILGLVISAAFLYWALNGLELDKFWSHLQGANYWWLLPGVAVYFIGVWVRTWRWHYLLRPLKPIPLSKLFPVVCIGYAGNNIYPARAGELLRAYILRVQEGVSVSANMATVVVERIFDGLVMLTFVIFALPFANFGDSYNNFVLFFSTLFLGALIVFLVMAARPEWTQQLVAFLVQRLVPARFQDSINNLVARFLEGLSSLRSGRDVLMIFVTSVLIWLLETMKYWFVMQAFPFDVSFAILMLMNGIVNLTTTLPAAPGHLGTFDGPGIQVLEAFGVPQAIATGYTLVLHAALWLPITLVGLIYLWQARLDIKRVRQEMEIVTE